MKIYAKNSKRRLAKRWVCAIVALIFLFNTCCPAWARSGNYGKGGDAWKAFAGGLLAGTVTALICGFNPVAGTVSSVVRDISDLVMYHAMYHDYGKTMFKIAGVKISKGQFWSMVSGVVAGGLAGFIEGAIEGAVEEAIENAIKSGMETAAQTAAQTAAGATVQAATQSIVQTIIQKLLDIIKKIFENIWNAIKSIPENIWNAIKSIPENIWNAIKSIPENIWNAIKSIPKAIKNFFSNPGKTLGDALKKIFKMKSASPYVRYGKELQFDRLLVQLAGDISVRTVMLYTSEAVKQKLEEAGWDETLASMLGNLVASYVGAFVTPIIMGSLGEVFGGWKLDNQAGLVDEEEFNALQNREQLKASVEITYQDANGNIKTVNMSDDAYGEILTAAEQGAVKIIGIAVGGQHIKVDGISGNNVKGQINQVLFNNFAAFAAELIRTEALFNLTGGLMYDIHGNYILKNNDLIGAGFKAVQNLGLVPVVQTAVKIALLKTLGYHTHYGTDQERIFENIWKMAIANAAGNIAGDLINNWIALGRLYAGSERSPFKTRDGLGLLPHLVRTSSREIGSVLDQIAWGYLCKTLDITPDAFYELLHLAGVNLLTGGTLTDTILYSSQATMLSSLSPYPYSDGTGLNAFMARWHVQDKWINSISAGARGATPADQILMMLASNLNYLANLSSAEYFSTLIANPMLPQEFRAQPVYVPGYGLVYKTEREHEDEAEGPIDISDELVRQFLMKYAEAKNDDKLLAALKIGSSKKKRTKTESFYKVGIPGLSWDQTLGSQIRDQIIYGDEQEQGERIEGLEGLRQRLNEEKQKKQADKDYAIDLDYIIGGLPGFAVFTLEQIEELSRKLGTGQLTGRLVIFSPNFLSQLGIRDTFGRIKEYRNFDIVYDSEAKEYRQVEGPKAIVHYGPFGPVLEIQKQSILRKASPPAQQKEELGLTPLPPPTSLPYEELLKMNLIISHDEPWYRLSGEYGNLYPEKYPDKYDTSDKALLEVVWALGVKGVNFDLLLGTYNPAAKRELNVEDIKYYKSHFAGITSDTKSLTIHQRRAIEAAMGAYQKAQGVKSPTFDMPYSTLYRLKSEIYSEIQPAPPAVGPAGQLQPYNIVKAQAPSTQKEEATSIKQGEFLSNVLYNLTLYPVGKGVSPYAGPSLRINAQDINFGVGLRAINFYQISPETMGILSQSKEGRAIAEHLSKDLSHVQDVMFFELKEFEGKLVSGISPLQQWIALPKWGIKVGYDRDNSTETARFSDVKSYTYDEQKVNNIIKDFLMLGVARHAIAGLSFVTTFDNPYYHALGLSTLGIQIPEYQESILRQDFYPVMPVNGPKKDKSPPQPEAKPTTQATLPTTAGVGGVSIDIEITPENFIQAQVAEPPQQKIPSSEAPIETAGIWEQAYKNAVLKYQEQKGSLKIDSLQDELLFRDLYDKELKQVQSSSKTPSEVINLPQPETTETKPPTQATLPTTTIPEATLPKARDLYDIINESPGGTESPSIVIPEIIKSLTDPSLNNNFYRWKEDFDVNMYDKQIDKLEIIVNGKKERTLYGSIDDYDKYMEEYSKYIKGKISHSSYINDNQVGLDLNLSDTPSLKNGENDVVIRQIYKDGSIKESRGKVILEGDVVNRDDYKVYFNGNSMNVLPSELREVIINTLDKLTKWYPNPNIFDKLDVYSKYEGYETIPKCKPEDKQISFNFTVLEDISGKKYNTEEKKGIIKHTLSHEFGHMIYHNLLSEDKKQEIKKCFDRLSTAQESNIDAIKIFWDGNYFPGEHGHPADDPDELFASAFAIKNLNFDKFKENYNNLPSDIKQTIDTFLALIPNKTADDIGPKGGVIDLQPASTNVQVDTVTTASRSVGSNLSDISVTPSVELAPKTQLPTLPSVNRLQSDARNDVMEVTLAKLEAQNEQQISQSKPKSLDFKNQLDPIVSGYKLVFDPYSHGERYIKEWDIVELFDKHKRK